MKKKSLMANQNSMMNALAYNAQLPCEEDFEKARNWVWTRTNGDQVTLGSLSRESFHKLANFVHKKLHEASKSIISYMHLEEQEKAQEKANQYAFLSEAREMMSNQRNASLPN
jgi:hypothetical protein